MIFELRHCERARQHSTEVVVVLLLLRLLLRLLLLLRLGR